MKKNFTAFLFSLIFLTLAFFNSLAQQVFKTTSSSVIGYLEYLPPDYNLNSNKYPIVFFLHGNGERGPNSTDPTVLDDYIHLVTKHGPPKLVKAGTKFPFILISPQLKSNVSNWNTTYIMEVINHCKTYLRIDEKRIYLTGLSLGGGGTWVAAQDKPELFAAVAPVCGGYNSTAKACGIAAENLPVWAFHGDKDSVVPLARSQNMVNAINACVPTPSPVAKLSIYPGVGHNAWDYAYRNDHTLHTPNVYEWLLSFTNVINKSNKIPVANAGADVIVSTSSKIINGSASDVDGTISGYKWTQISGPTLPISNLTSASLSLSNLAIGEYVFRFSVTDNSGNTDSDYIKITRTESTNAVPIAYAGSDRVITLPVNSIILNGSGKDSDGTITSYSWKKISGPSLSIGSTNTSTLSLSNMVQGSYVFRLTVTDNNGGIDTDDLLVKVNAPVIPVVSAGMDKLVKLPTNSATIYGSATDAGGTIVSYKWTKISGGSCTMAYTTSPTLKLGSLVSGVYTFRLTATDNDGYTGYDDVVVTVNAVPKANAGTDITVTLPLSSSIVLKGSGTDSDGTIVKYLWSKYSGPNLTGENSTSSDYTLVKLYEGTYVFKLAVTDNSGLQGIDYVTVTVKSEAITEAAISGGVNLIVDTDMQKSVDVSSLGDQSFDVLEKSTVTIFNKTGELIYQGEWSSVEEREILRNGFYMYHIFKDGLHLKSGKIYKKGI